ncbi:hypothetical protein [Bradyrhizobium sp. WSM2793]|uniref:hypothetical protein n=1 Tax=Bradyrhizobium sp. WSM2793 TaxID=1038866 RepID=UPI00037A0BA6|nr:hypothetical protein [Bradyrhizobium sp. WSM2793]
MLLSFEISQQSAIPEGSVIRLADWRGPQIKDRDDSVCELSAVGLAEVETVLRRIKPAKSCRQFNRETWLAQSTAICGEFRHVNV